MIYHLCFIGFLFATFQHDLLCNMASAVSVPTTSPSQVPTTNCVDVLDFALDGNYYGTVTGVCHSFPFLASGNMITACGYNLTTGLPANLTFKDQSSFVEFESGLGMVNFRGEDISKREIPISGFVQVDASTLHGSKQPQFMMGSTHTNFDHVTPEYYCLYGTNRKGRRGRTLLYKDVLEGVFINFPATFARFSYVSFTACADNIFIFADVLIMQFAIVNGISCTAQPTISPSCVPTTEPSASPSFLPSVKPSCMPSFRPSIKPSYFPL